MMFIFFFKQKTAYELRISDWSSDVCSSDLSEALARRAAASRHEHRLPVIRHVGLLLRPQPGRHIRRLRIRQPLRRSSAPQHDQARQLIRCWRGLLKALRSSGPGAPDRLLAAPDARLDSMHRSEEHTSELQSLMRISYAVFCLKKKNSK